jgi:class 3 adenylate cyclase
MAAESPALAQILGAEAWRNERALNAFRASFWTLIGAATGGAELLASGTISPGALIALGWGVLAALLGVVVLRRAYRNWISAALSSADITVLAVCMDAGHRYLLQHDPALAPHQLTASGIVLMTLLAADVLRFSWRLSVWSVAYGAAAYAVVLWRNDAVDVLTYVELLSIALLGWVLALSARRLDAVVRQVVQRDALVRFLPAPVVERIARDPGTVRLGGEAQVVTALFMDLRGFTTLAEAMAPDAVVALLNEFFSEMADEVSTRGGIPVQYVGDNLYAVFPASGGADHARRAVKAGRGLLRRLQVLNRRRHGRGEAPLAAGIGLHSGPVVAGPIGSPHLLQYTYIGDTVNTASRIQALTRSMESPLLVSGPTLALAGGPARFGAMPVGETQLRGKRGVLPIWAVPA